MLRSHQSRQQKPLLLLITLIDVQVPLYSPRASAIRCCNLSIVDRLCCMRSHNIIKNVRQDFPPDVNEVPRRKRTVYQEAL